MPKTNETKTTKSAQEQEALDQEMCEAIIPGLENVSVDGTSAPIAEVIKNAANQKMADVFEKCECLGDVTLGEFVKLSNNKIKELTGWDKDVIREYKTAAKNEINPPKEEDKDMVEQNQESQEVESEVQKQVEETVEQQVTEPEPAMDSSEEVPEKKHERTEPVIREGAFDESMRVYALWKSYKDFNNPKKTISGYQILFDFRDEKGKISNDSRMARFKTSTKCLYKKEKFYFFFSQVSAPDGATEINGISIGDYRWPWYALNDEARCLPEKFLKKFNPAPNTWNWRISDGVFVEFCPDGTPEAKMDLQDKDAIREERETSMAIGHMLSEEQKAAFKKLPNKPAPAAKPKTVKVVTKTTKTKEKPEDLGIKLGFAFESDRDAGKIKSQADLINWIKMKSGNYGITPAEVKHLAEESGFTICLK